MDTRPTVTTVCYSTQAVTFVNTVVALAGRAAEGRAVTGGLLE